MVDPIHQQTASDLDIALLSSLPLFAHVPLDLLASIPYEDVLRYYHDGDVILQQGDQANCLIILLHGQARVLTDNIFLTARKPYDIWLILKISVSACLDSDLLLRLYSHR